MEKRRLETILFFTILLFLFLFPFQLTVAQGTGTTSGITPGKTPPTTPPQTTTTSGNTPGNTTTPKARCLLYNDYEAANNVPLKQLVNTLKGGANVTIEGTVSILDSCTFQVSGFTYFFAATNTYWFGNDHTGGELKLVSNTSVGQSQSSTKNFGLKPDIAFTDFSILNLYSVDEKTTFAQAELRPKKNSDTGSNPVPTESKTSQSNKLSFDLYMMTKMIGIWVILIWTL